MIDLHLRNEQPSGNRGRVRRLSRMVAALIAVGGAAAALSAAEPHPMTIRAAPAVAGKARPDPAPTLRSLPAERQAALAFEALFGSGERRIRSGDGTVYFYDKGVLVWSNFGAILIAEGQADAFPDVSGTLGIFYLREGAGRRFEEVWRWPDAIGGSMMGNPPEWRIRSDMGPYPVIESTSGGIWQGYSCATTTLTELAPGGPRSLVTFDSHYSSEGAEGDAGEVYDGDIVHVVPGRSFDVAFSGARQTTQHFVRQGDAFVRVPQLRETLETNAIPTC